MVKRVKKIIGMMIRWLYRVSYRCIPCQKQTILFISFHGKGYSDNPKAIHEYLMQYIEFSEYRFIWAIKHHKKKNITIPNAKIIEYFSISYFYYLARSKYWIVNCKLPNYVLKKPNQIYLQTWHGTPLKKLAHDIEVPETTTFYRSGMTLHEMHTSYDIDVSKYTYMLSPSAFTTKVFQSAFGINAARLLETGYPRNDILSNYTLEMVNKVKRKYGIPKDKKVILYAPTWRDNSFTMKGYTFTLEVDFALWQRLLGPEYIILFKPHYLIVNDFDVEQFKDFVYYIEPENEISDLYIISDVLITDYSSVFFDYAILERPIYFYMYDIEIYKNELRGFYLDIYEDLPGDVFVSEREMLEEVVSGVYNDQRVTTFNQKFNNREDGKASERVVNAILR